jgi:hypothetical protein
MRHIKNKEEFKQLFTQQPDGTWEYKVSTSIFIKPTAMEEHPLSLLIELYNTELKKSLRKFQDFVANGQIKPLLHLAKK